MATGMNPQFHAMLTAGGMNAGDLMTFSRNFLQGGIDVSEAYLGELSPMQTPIAGRAQGVQTPEAGGGIA